MSDKTHDYWVALASAGRIGRKTATRLLEAFGSLERIFAANTAELIKVPSVGRRTAANIKAIDLAATKTLIDYCTQSNISILTPASPNFPSQLAQLADSPIILFCRGDESHLAYPSVAIVGTRSPTTDRVALAVQLGEELSKRGWVIVSGLALGIDTAAHVGALRASAATIAVLGGGLNKLYPLENKQLAHQIEATGVIISEYAPDTNVSPSGLRARNRITSGLAQAVIVVEAQKDSGSLATARLAQKQGRRVFAIDGADAGCQHLIANGAIPLRPPVDWHQLERKLTNLKEG